MFQKLQQSDTCNPVKSCTKHGRPDQSQRELTVALTKHTSMKIVHFSCYGRKVHQ